MEHVCVQRSREDLTTAALTIVRQGKESFSCSLSTKPPQGRILSKKKVLKIILYREKQIPEMMC